MSVKAPITVTVVVPSRFSSEQLPDFQKEMEARIEEGASVIQLDCSKIEYATSSHINALWLVLRMCQQHAAALKLESPTAQLIRVLQVMDLYEVFADFGLDELGDHTLTSLPTAGQTYDTRFAARLDSLHDVLNQYLVWMQKIGLSDVDKVELQTVFYEVVGNIIEHAGLGDTDMIDFSALTTEGGLRMVFVDRGIVFDPAARAEVIDIGEAARKLQTRGYGLAMISQLVDKMEYERVDDRRNQLTLTRKWHG